MSCLLDTNILSSHLRRPCTKESGRLRVELRRQGINVAALDLLIAVVALLYDLSVVTHNTKDFENIPGLRLDDWLTP